MGTQTDGEILLADVDEGIDHAVGGLTSGERHGGFRIQDRELREEEVGVKRVFCLEERGGGKGLRCNFCAITQRRCCSPSPSRNNTSGER